MGRFFRQLYLAITDFEFYKSIFDQPFRQTLLFLLYIAASVTLIQTLLYGYQYSPAVNDFFECPGARGLLGARAALILSSRSSQI